MTPHFRPIQSAFTSASLFRHQPLCCSPFRRFYASRPPPEDHIARLRSQIVSFHHGSIQPSVDASRKYLTARSSQLITSLARHATELGLKMNEVTGYHEVEKLKALVAGQGEFGLLAMCFQGSRLIVQKGRCRMPDTLPVRPSLPTTRLFPTAQTLKETSTRYWSGSIRGLTPMS